MISEEIPTNITEYVSGYQEEYKEHIYILDIIEDADIMKNCMICGDKKKIVEEDLRNKSIYTIFKDAKMKCKICLSIIARRKCCLKYVQEYFTAYKKLYFNIKIIKNYIRSKFQYHEMINNCLHLIIKEMVNAKMIAPERKSSSKIIYKVLNTNFDDTFANEATTRAFGCLQGIKKSDIA